MRAPLSGQAEIAGGSATRSGPAGGVVKVGLIADTHGLLRPEALHALRGSDWIIHAGDVGGAWILEALSEIAPVVAVRGNNDHGPWADALHETCRLDLGSTAVFVIHDLSALAIDPIAAGLRVLVSGHSHRLVSREENGILFVNPGSAGPRRFRLPVTLGRLSITDSAVSAELLPLLPAPVTGKATSSRR
jgi:putative phosphoesterase